MAISGAMYAGVPPMAVGLKHGGHVGELGRDPRQPPVHHQHFAEVAEHDVFGLQVAVNDAARVGERHGIGDAQQDAQVFVEPASGR